LVAGHPALDLVNTLDWRFRNAGPQELVKDYSDLLLFGEQSKLLTGPQVRELRRSANGAAAARTRASCLELREAVAEVLYAELDGRGPAAASLKVLERHFKDAQSHLTLSRVESHWAWQWPRIGNAELPLWMLSLSASELMTGEDIQRVRACGDPDCRWLFLDTSKNHTRRWCDMKLCGNRMKARRFKAQHSS
jgi:predicted RNA-binding Zn ribbon-like protein